MKSIDEQVYRLYYEALVTIAQSGRQSPEMRIARKALKDASFLRISGGFRPLTEEEFEKHFGDLPSDGEG